MSETKTGRWRWSDAIAGVILGSALTILDKVTGIDKLPFMSSLLIMCAIGVGLGAIIGLVRRSRARPAH